MPVDRAPTQAQGRESFELATLYSVVRATIEAIDVRESLGRGLYRGDVAAEMRMKLKLEKVRGWVDSIDAERVRMNAGVNGDGV
jgi:hypothetical protein